MKTPAKLLVLLALLIWALILLWRHGHATAKLGFPTREEANNLGLCPTDNGCFVVGNDDRGINP